MSKKYIYGIQGGKGSFNEQALKQFLKNSNIDSYEVRYLYTTEKVLSAVESCEVDFGVFAIVNSLGGLVEESIKILGKYNFEYESQITIQISHYLMKLKSIESNEIHRITAHPQVLTQCKNTLTSTYSEYTPSSGENDLIDTAKFAEALYEGRVDPYTYLLGPKILSTLYGFDIVKENLEDKEDNRTSFLIVKPINKDEAK